MISALAEVLAANFCDGCGVPFRGAVLPRARPHSTSPCWQDTKEDLDSADEEDQDTEAIYYALDHRRLHCMREACCEHIRVRIQLCGRSVDEFVNKARERLGQHSMISIR